MAVIKKKSTYKWKLKDISSHFSFQILGKSQGKHTLKLNLRVYESMHANIHLANWCIKSTIY